MQSVATIPDLDYYTRAANNDCFYGGPSTRTKYTLSYTCPAGYSFNGTNCTETIKTEPAHLVCGSPDIGVSAHSRAQGITQNTCPGNKGYYECSGSGNWTLIGTTCYDIVVQAATPTYSCPAGYALSGTTCTGTVTQAATPSYSCPAGYTLSGSTCSGTVTVSATVESYSCPAGYVLSGATCSETLTVAATNSGPGILVAESFTAFGNRRSGETWSGAPSGPDETTINGVSRWGYTGQTQLGVSMGLNHMNGRVQDAITGRFLSPDPNIPDPGNTQSFNRYSYVNNNPLTMVDPTGFDQQLPDEHCDDCAGSGTGGDGNGDPGGSGSDNPTEQLPDTGCGYAPYGPCPRDSIPPLPTLQTPTLTSLLLNTRFGAGAVVPKKPTANTGKSSPSKSAQSPTPDCGTILPDGRTVGSYVNQAAQETLQAQSNSEQSGSDSVGPFLQGYISDSDSHGLLDFKNNFRGQADPAFLGAAGNFAFGALTGQLFGSDSFGLYTALSGAGVYASGAGKPGPGTPFLVAPYGGDPRAQQNVPAGVSAGCKSKSP
jgi:RHS repeat-associated protein